MCCLISTYRWQRQTWRTRSHLSSTEQPRQNTTWGSAQTHSLPGNYPQVGNALANRYSKGHMLNPSSRHRPAFLSLGLFETVIFLAFQAFLSMSHVPTLLGFKIPARGLKEQLWFSFGSSVKIQPPLTSFPPLISSLDKGTSPLCGSALFRHSPLSRSTIDII